jgi:hypothetical protein
MKKSLDVELRVRAAKESLDAYAAQARAGILTPEDVASARAHLITALINTAILLSEGSR